MTVVDGGIVRQLSQVRQRMVHLFRSAFEESPTTSKEQGVTVTDIRGTASLMDLEEQLTL